MERINQNLVASLEYVSAAMAMKNLYYKGIENIPVAKDEDIPESERILGGEKSKDTDKRSVTGLLINKNSTMNISSDIELVMEIV